MFNYAKFLKTIIYWFNLKKEKILGFFCFSIIIDYSMYTNILLDQALSQSEGFLAFAITS
jgi:hypothetical protein